jgi:hypothetical protein
MRVEIQHWNAQSYSITSMNPALVGEWFGEWAPRLMTADCRYEVRIRIWPQTHEEMQTIGSVDATFTQDGLLHLAERILEASKKLGEMESARM